jgi:hypothetical protein
VAGLARGPVWLCAKYMAAVSTHADYDPAAPKWSCAWDMLADVLKPTPTTKASVSPPPPLSSTSSSLADPPSSSANSAASSVVSLK